MPTYDYKCDTCGHTFEKFQSIKADPIKVCPNCGQESVRRLIGTGAGLIFKGSGFYITDYRDKGYTEKAKAESGGGETKSDTKPAGGDSAAKPAADAKPAAGATPTSTPNPTPTPSAPPAKSGA